MITITGATGELGKLVVEGLLQRLPANQIIAAVRNPGKAASLAAKGVEVREADFTRPETLASAFAGSKRLLLISTNLVGPERQRQQRAAIDAAKLAGVELVAYTSLLRANTSKLLLAEDHLATEEYLRASGVPFTLLRNGWYTENFTAGLASALQQGAIVGASGDGRFAAAARADYAAAAVAVLTGDGHKNQIYELAGDQPFTRAELAAQVGRQSGKVIVNRDLPEAEFEKILATFLPPKMARILADAEARAAEGALDDPSHALRSLIGRSTTPLEETVAAALKSL